MSEFQHTIYCSGDMLGTDFENPGDERFLKLLICYGMRARGFGMHLEMVALVILTISFWIVLVACSSPDGDALVEIPSSSAEASEDRDLIAVVRQYAHPVTGTSRDYDPLISMIGDNRFVLLGESTHGTHEFYRERAKITRR